MPDSIKIFGVIKEPAANIIVAPGVWSINDIYDNVKAGTWTNNGAYI